MHAGSSPGGMLPDRAGGRPRMLVTSPFSSGAESMLFDVLFDPGISLQVMV
jgi:hypothetical protein